MFALVLGAVRARTAQVLTVLVLTALATIAAAAGPWFATAATTSAAEADVAAAPAAQRTLSVRQQLGTNGQPQASLDSFADAVGAILTVGDGAPILGIRQQMTVARSGADRTISVSARDGFCDHVVLSGTCPATTGDAVLSTEVAEQLGLAVGDRFTVRSAPGAVPVPLRVSGTYELTDPLGAYWSDPLFRSDGGLDPLFTTIDTFENRQLWTATVTYDVGVPAALLRGDNGYRLGRQLREIDARLSAAQLQLVNATPPLLEAIERDKATVRQGVLVAVGEVLVLGWFAIALAGRYTGRDRRGDAALLKLRGSTRLSMLRLTVGQHLVPLLGGAIVGAPAGFLLARLLAGPVTGAQLRQTFALAAIAVAVVIAGGLLMLILVEAAVLWQPVAALLRRVPAARRDWRAGVVDLVLVAVAVAAVYQARTGGSDNSLGLLAPVLVALAVALVLAWLLIRVADRAGGSAVRRGRLGFGLTAVQVSRQPGLDRVFALVVVAIAMFAIAAGGWTAGRQARAERSAVELGAARVLTVGADNRTELEHAVRQADPGGRYAMAAFVDVASTPPILAVDSPRLAAVAQWRPEYGPLTALPTAVAGARVPDPVPLVTGDTLTLRVQNAGKIPVSLVAVLQNEETGATVPVLLGPARAGGETVTVSAPVTGCAGAGCRLTRFELVTPPAPGEQPGSIPIGANVTIRGLSQQGPARDILDPARLADIARWHSGTFGPALDLAAADGGLTLSVDANFLRQSPIGNEVYPVDTPQPVPIVLAGPEPLPWRTSDAVVSFGREPSPVRVVAGASVLPVLGLKGMLVDLDTVRRIAADTDTGGTMQVWLTADAPASIVPALTRAGLQVISDDSGPARSERLAGQGSAVAAQFALLCAAIALLLAAAAVAVAAAVDRGAQAEQLQALRTQGLPRRATVVIAYAGQAGLLVAGLLGGLAAAALATPLAEVSAPRFTDGWQVIALPDPLSPAALAGAALIALIVLGFTCWLSARALARRAGEGVR